MKIYKYKELGSTDYGWLYAHYHFSFANYFNPQRLGLGNLVVINDDIIQPHTGFNTHSHQDMEIITYVRSGAISHKDSEGHEGKTEAGDVQVMSAGSGIAHSEHNKENEATCLYQIWIKPKKNGLKPGWKSHQFPKKPVEDKLYLLVSGDGKAPLHINQDARIYAGILKSGVQIKHSISTLAYVLISRGQLSINNEDVEGGDGIELNSPVDLDIQAQSEAEILIIEV